MAEETQTTDLAMPDDSISDTNIHSSDLNDIDIQNPDLGEKSSSRFDMAVGDLDLLRQVVLVISISICVALIVMLFFWIKQPELRPLGNYETEELIPILDYLDKQKVEYSLEGNTLRVPVSDYDMLKLDLVRAGFTQSGAPGDDILLNDMGFGVSQRLERERLKLSREKQLSSTIEQMMPVRKAQVLLALPKQSVFVRHNQDASATVFLTLKTGANLKQEEVDSIVDMVASAVPSMKSTKVTVTDQHGRLLSSGSEDPLSTARRKETELEQKQEDDIREKIDSVLMPILGIGNYTAQVDIELDFSKREQTRKQFDPKSPAATRSEYTLEDYNNGNIVAGVPGALSNQPPADASIPQDVAQLKDGSLLGEGSSHKEATRNYELDTTISHERSQTGTIVRQTVSVAIKHHQKVDPETGEIAYEALTEGEIGSIRKLLEGAVGYSSARGDLLNVLSMKFATPKVETIAEGPIWEDPRFSDWIRWLASALVIVAVLLILVRPAMNKLLNPKSADEDDQELGPDGLPLSSEDALGLLGADVDDGTIEFGSGVDLPNLNKDDDVLKAVRALVANEPELAAQVIKNWIG